MYLQKVFGGGRGGKKGRNNFGRCSLKKKQILDNTLLFAPITKIYEKKLKYELASFEKIARKEKKTNERESFESNFHNILSRVNSSKVANTIKNHSSSNR